jgi:hypothetical protein
MNRPDYRPIKTVKIGGDETREAFDLVTDIVTDTIKNVILPKLDALGASEHPQVNCAIVVNALIGVIADGVGSIHSLNGCEEEDMLPFCHVLEDAVNAEIRRKAPFHNHN